MSAFNLETCARPNILSLQPYRCARDDYENNGTNILLDANENAYGPGLALEHFNTAMNETANGQTNGTTGAGQVQGVDLLGLNRYPDPHQIELKQRFCDYRNPHVQSSKKLTPSNLFIGVGSDEAIDAILRCFCRPGQDKMLTCPPTYGMYAVSAQVNDVGVVHVPLDVDNDFDVQPALINAALSNDPSIKLVYLCSPGNPTAKLVSKAAVCDILAHRTWNGAVVIDEAYVDFSDPSRSLAGLVLDHPNLIVMQTLSKAFGLAGLRIGAAFTSPAIARLLNNLKAPYNISSPTSAVATVAFLPDHLAVMQHHRASILAQRARLVKELPRIPGVGRFKGGFDANFVLVEMLSGDGGKPSNRVALAVYETLAEQKGVVVRFRGKELGCEGCLRVTVGTEAEVDTFLERLTEVLQGIYRGDKNPSRPGLEEQERRANDVIA